MSRRTLLVGLAASLAAAVASGCGSRERDGMPNGAARHDAITAPQAGARAPSSLRPTGCPVTPPNHSIPPGQGRNPGATRAPYYGNGRLWTVLFADGIVREAPHGDGSIAEKFPWALYPAALRAEIERRAGVPCPAAVPEGVAAPARGDAARREPASARGKRNPKNEIAIAYGARPITH
jgi:hypothetical protein